MTYRPLPDNLRPQKPPLNEQQRTKQFLEDVHHLIQASALEAGMLLSSTIQYLSVQSDWIRVCYLRFLEDLIKETTNVKK